MARFAFKDKDKEFWMEQRHMGRTLAGRTLAARAGQLLRMSGAGILMMAAAGCSPELDYGSWEAALTGTRTDFSGATADWSGTVQIDVAYDKSRGSLSYEMTVCEGLVDYYSSTPCFNTLEVLDTTDGLVGTQEEGWQADLGDEELVICQGTESVSIAGDATSKTAADIELTYHLNLSSSSSGGCDERLSGESARIIASGTMTHVSP